MTRIALAQVAGNIYTFEKAIYKDCKIPCMIGSKHMLKIFAAILPFRLPSIVRIQGLCESDWVGVV